LTKPTSQDITTPQLEKMVTNLTKFELSFGRNMHILLDELNHFAATGLKPLPTTLAKHVKYGVLQQLKLLSI